MPTADPERFRAVMSRFATGVAVMTSVRDGTPHGMTANAIASVSLDPLLVLVCVERGTVMETTVAASERFALSFLADDQQGLSERFADRSRPEGHAQFDGVPIGAATTGAPILRECLGWVDCQVWATYDGGDHVIVVGEVVDLGLGGRTEALAYYRSAYQRLCADEPVRPDR